MDVAYEAADDLEMGLSTLPWNLFTPPERRGVVALLEQLSDSIRGIANTVCGRIEKLAALEPGTEESGDEIIDMILADPHGMPAADARRIVALSDRAIEKLKRLQAERDTGSGPPGGDGATHTNPPACYVRPVLPPVG